MSYEPTIIVERKDLENKTDELAKLDMEEDEVGQYLYRITMNLEFCSFKDMEIFVFQPEFSSFNKKIRDWLNKNNIKYGESN